MDQIAQRYDHALAALAHAVTSQPVLTNEELIKSLRSSACSSRSATKHKPAILGSSPLKDFNRHRVRLEKLLDKYTSEGENGDIEAVEAPESQTASSSSGAKADEIHAVRPWNYSDFLRRVKTFSVPAWWFAKLDSLSPIALARNGWTNVGMNRLQCENCKSHYTDSDHIGDAVTTVAALRDLHDSACEWRCSDCSADFERIPNSQGDPLALSSDVDARAKSLVKTLRLCVSSSATLSPSLSHSLLVGDNWPLGERLRALLPLTSEVASLAIECDAVPDKVSLSLLKAIKAADSDARTQCALLGLLCLSVCGWEGEGETLVCGVCRRAVKAKDYLDGKRVFDPLSGHRYFCPWVQHHSPEGLQGWEVALQEIEQALKSTTLAGTPAGKRKSEADIESVGDNVATQSLPLNETYKKIRTLLDDAAKSWNPAV